VVRATDAARPPAEGRVTVAGNNRHAAVPVALDPLPPLLYEPLVRRALEEDLGRAGDLTTDATVAPHLRAVGRLVARRPGRIAGLPIAAAAFRLLDPAVEVELAAADGDDVAAGAVLAVVRGPARPILTAERVALNFLGHLSGIATATADLVRRVEAAAPGCRVACTRKTTPGLRALEKYAVRAGGGVNHRFGLDDAVLIKDNHLAVAGGVAAAVARVRQRVGHLVKVEVEVDTLEQLDQALAAGVDAVLLDNMTPEQLREAVARVAGRATTEASGGITPDTAAAVAATGVDLLSAGWLTHSAASLDVALDLDIG
jgi:nicotinate-nucleotide pyrophosphorylase (carboxylating)